MKIEGRLIDLSFGLNQKQRITIKVNQDFREAFDGLKDCVVEIEINALYQPTPISMCWSTKLLRHKA